MEKINNDIQQKIDVLTKQIAEDPADAQLYLTRGKLYNSAGVRNMAMNDFIKCTELDPDNTEAKQYIEMIREIYAFRYLDYYNP